MKLVYVFEVWTNVLSESAGVKIQGCYLVPPGQKYISSASTWVSPRAHVWEYMRAHVDLNCELLATCMTLFSSPAFRSGGDSATSPVVQIFQRLQAGE